jgi:L-lactate utilization protein LutC
MSTRESFLARVREAVRQGNQAGNVPPLPGRGTLGYQGGGPDPLARFCQELEAVGGKPHVVEKDEDVLAVVLNLLARHQARHVLFDASPLVARLDLADSLSRNGLEVSLLVDLTPATAREPFFAADVGITGVAHLVAETGSLVMRSSPGSPRSVSLLPPVHIAVAERDQLVADLFDLFPPGSNDPPACLNLITGPSKTGDIELRLVTGVHGPGEVHVIILAPTEGDVQTG